MRRKFGVLRYHRRRADANEPICALGPEKSAEYPDSLLPAANPCARAGLIGRVIADNHSPSVSNFSPLRARKPAPSR